MSLFTTHRRLLQIFLVSKLFSTNTYQVELEILRNSLTIFRSSHRRCSIKKLLSNILWYSQKNTCVGGSFWITLLAIRPVTLFAKGLQHRYILANIEKFVRRPILKNICERLHFWKAFCETIFYIRLSKRNYWWLAQWKVAQISQNWTKMLCYNKLLGEEIFILKKIKLLYKSETTAIGKSFM